MWKAIRQAKKQLDELPAKFMCKVLHHFSNALEEQSTRFIYAANRQYNIPKT